MNVKVSEQRAFAGWFCIALGIADYMVATTHPHYPLYWALIGTVSIGGGLLYLKSAKDLKKKGR